MDAQSRYTKRRKPDIEEPDDELEQIRRIEEHAEENLNHANQTNP